MLRDFFLGFVKIHILHHAEQESVYGLALIQELQRHGYELSPGTLYPILHQLAGQGYLTVEERVVGGKVRKYYATTAAGSQALAEARIKIRELVDEVLQGHGPISLPDDPPSALPFREDTETRQNPEGSGDRENDL
jgi:PadR family transcriptional regulator, regulatory protein PadR